MDDQTALLLAVQLTALSCIAGSLLLYLLCKVRRGPGADTSTKCRSVLVTSVESQLGLELALRLSARGFRVFCGLLEPDGPAAKVLKAKVKGLEAEGNPHGAVVLLPLDTTREDSLHEGVDHIRRHLPAGQNGLWAVVNTAGSVCKGRLELQESAAWESMFKVNVVGTLRTARALLPLLKATKGRLLTVGLSGECCGGGAGAVAYTAARHAVAGASGALRQELAATGVCVIVLNTGGIRAEGLYRQVRPRDDIGAESYLNYRTDILPDYALSTIEEALLNPVPKECYELRPPVSLGNMIARRFWKDTNKPTAGGQPQSATV